METTVMNYQGYFMDLDGTTYRGKDQIASAARFVKRLQQENKQLLFVTNNSTRSPQFVADNLRQNHDINVTAENVYTTALATADYLDEKATKKRSMYVVGESGLKDALLKKGFFFDEVAPNYVIVGLDSDVTYHKLQLAVLAIRNGATFIGTNADSNLPNEQGMVPGAGSIVKLVEYATQTRPIMIGKPEKIIMEMALKKCQLDRSQVIMVGDNIHTDIQAGINVSMDTLLVYTGLSTKEDVEKDQIFPTYQVKTLDEWQFDEN